MFNHTRFIKPAAAVVLKWQELEDSKVGFPWCYKVWTCKKHWSFCYLILYFCIQSQVSMKAEWQRTGGKSGQRNVGEGWDGCQWWSYVLVWGLPVCWKLDQKSLSRWMLKLPAASSSGKEDSLGLQRSFRVNLVDDRWHLSEFEQYDNGHRDFAK